MASSHSTAGDFWDTNLCPALLSPASTASAQSPPRDFWDQGLGSKPSSSPSGTEEAHQSDSRFTSPQAVTTTPNARKESPNPSQLDHQFSKRPSTWRSDCPGALTEDIRIENVTLEDISKNMGDFPEPKGEWSTHSGCTILNDSTLETQSKLVSGVVNIGDSPGHVTTDSPGTPRRTENELCNNGTGHDEISFEEDEYEVERLDAKLGEKDGHWRYSTQSICSKGQD
ncbi:unnamed protein product, partial [Clonostachys chloroleuca]